MVLTLAVFSSSCFTSNKPAARFTPPPPPPPVVASVEHLPEPPMTASLPDLSGGSIVPNGVSEAPPPPAPKPPARRPIRPAPPVVTPPVEATPAPPKLGQMLTPEQTREYNRTIDESLDRVRKIVATMSRRTLTPDQTEILNRVLVFQRQAEENRAQDLMVAVSLAKRADLLAKDLQDRVQ
jgi:hypothetical protein